MSTSDSTLGFDDTLEPLGLATAAFLVIVGLGTLAGTPWNTGALLAGIVQSLGGVLAALLGVALAWIIRR